MKRSIFPSSACIHGVLAALGLAAVLPWRTFERRHCFAVPHCRETLLTALELRHPAIVSAPQSFADQEYAAAESVMLHPSLTKPSSCYHREKFCCCSPSCCLPEERKLLPESRCRGTPCCSYITTKVLSRRKITALPLTASLPQRTTKGRSKEPLPHQNRSPPQSCWIGLPSSSLPPPYCYRYRCSPDPRHALPPCHVTPCHLAGALFGAFQVSPTSEFAIAIPHGRREDLSCCGALWPKSGSRSVAALPSAALLVAPTLLLWSLAEETSTTVLARRKPLAGLPFGVSTPLHCRNDHVADQLEVKLPPYTSLSSLTATAEASPEPRSPGTLPPCSQPIIALPPSSAWSCTAAWPPGFA